LGDGVEIGALRDKSRASDALGGDVVVAGVGEGLDVLGAGFDGGGLDIDIGAGVVSLDDADVIEEEFVAAWCAELAGLFEEAADFGGGAVVVVGQDLDDDGDLVRGVALEHNVVHGQLVIAGAGAFLDGALDDIAADALPARLFDGGKETGVAGGIAAAHFRGDHDFLDQFADGLALSEGGDFAFSVEPLTTHGGIKGENSKIEIRKSKDLRRDKQKEAKGAKV
jgi:hypothetical protein